jgi:hypothetical protein
MQVGALRGRDKVNELVLPQEARDGLTAWGLWHVLAGLRARVRTAPESRAPRKRAAGVALASGMSHLPELVEYREG